MITYRNLRYVSGSADDETTQGDATCPDDLGGVLSCPRPGVLRIGSCTVSGHLDIWCDGEGLVVEGMTEYGPTVITDAFMLVADVDLNEGDG